MNHSIFAFRNTLLMIIVFFAFFACQKDLPYQVSDPNLPGGQDSSIVSQDSILAQMDSVQRALCIDFNTYLRNLTKYPNPPETAQTYGDTAVVNEGGYVCESVQVSWSPAFEEQYLTSPNLNILPGQLYDGNSIADGSYKMILAPRDSIKVSISIPTSPGSDAGIWIKNPNSIADIRNTVNELVRRTASGATPAQVLYEIVQVRSSEEATLHLKASASGWGAKITGSYDFNSYTQQTKVLVRFQQIYFSIDTDPVITPCTLFNPVPSPEEAQTIFGGTSPVYVSSVRYGRTVYYMIQSDSSFQDVKKALTAGFDKWGVNASAELEDKDKQVLSNSTINALVVGGSADGAVRGIFSLDSMKTFIREGGDFTPDNHIGVPISYDLKFAADGSTARVVQSSEYTIRNCEVYTEELMITPQLSEPQWVCANETGNGDRDFDGHGPEVDGDFQLFHENGEIKLRTSVTWKETVFDWTEGIGAETFVIAVIPNGYVFAGFVDSENAYFNYTDTDHEPDYEEITGGSFIGDLKVIGDTDGDDVECGDDDNDSHVEFMILPFKIYVRKL